MSTYFIGDVHGCYKNLQAMLDYVRFDPNVDMLYLTGDLVSRGPNSLEVLRLIHSFNKNASTVLGNHDLHLLKTYFEKNYHQSSQNPFHSILYAPDVEELMYWLCHQPILYINENKKILMSHAGIHPHWNIHNIKKYAHEIEELLTSNHPDLLFKKNFTNIYNTHPINIKKIKRIQKNIDVFTRMRYIHSDGQLNMRYKNTPKYAPTHIYPWFNFPQSATSKYSIIFGHWASLKNTKTPNGIYGLDSGCCWGGALTLLRWEDKKIINMPCVPPI